MRNILTFFRRFDFWDLVPLLLLGIWTLGAISILPIHGHFLFDEAYFYYQTTEVVHRFGSYFPVYGPPISGTDPLAFTPGGGLYLALSLPFFISGDPRWGTIWIILLSSFGITFLHRTLAKEGFSPTLRGACTLFLTWTTWHARMTDRLWNVNIYWFTSLLLLSFFIRFKSKPNLFISLLIGLLSALVTQVHLGGALAVFTCCTYLFFQDRVAMRHLIPSATLGGLIAYIPYFFYELKHGFFNTLSMIHNSPREFHWFTIRNSLLSSPVFVSLFDSSVNWNPFHTPQDHAYLISILGSAVGIYFYLLGLLKKHPLRPLVISSIVIMPFYLVATGRGLHYHYVGALIPYFTIGVALGFENLRKASLLQRRKAYGMLVLFILSSGYRSVLDYCESHIGLKALAARVDFVKNQVPYRAPVTLTSSSEYEEAFYNWVIGKAMFRSEPIYLLRGRSKPCQIAVGNFPFQERIGLDIGWVCD